MHPIRQLTSVAFTIIACHATAQTATWLGQSPGDSNRLSPWTDGANWSTGTAPNGPTAVAQLDQSYYTSSGLDARDGAQILTDVSLDALQYAIYTTDYDYPHLGVPGITIGGSGASDRGSLSFTGAGIRNTSSESYYSPVPTLTLLNGDLTFANQAAVTAKLTLQATTGTNHILLEDDSVVQGARIFLGDSSLLTLRDRARLTGTEVSFAGGKVVAANNTLVQDSYFTITGAGLLEFSGQSRVSNVAFTFARTAPGTDSIIRFSGQAVWTGHYGIRGSGAGSVEVTDQANAWSHGGAGGISGVRRVDISGASTGMGSTGRIRAISGDLATSSVVADDARTVTTGAVSATDLLLGSNTLQLAGGELYTIRDTGGAYLSANGSNLSGGGLIMKGENWLYLRPGFDPEPYAVPLTITYGVVYNYRQRLGAVTVNGGLDPNYAGSLYLYAGTLTSLTNSGSVYLGAATTQIVGDFIQTETGRLVIPPNHSATNKVIIAGTGRLGGTLSLAYNPAFFVGSRRHVILTANQLVGQFDTAPNLTLSSMLSVGVEYSDKEVFFVFTQHPFVNAGATPSQQALGGHLDATLGQASGNFYQLLLRLNGNQNPALVAAGLGQLAPDRYGVLNEQGFTVAASRQAALDRRLATWRAAPGPGRFVTFAEGSRLENKFASLDGLPEVRFTSRGGIAGAAWRRDRWILGVSAAKDTARANLDDWGSTARIESTAPGIFARYDRDSFFIHGATTRSSDRYALLRNSGLLNWPAMVSGRVRGSRTDLALTAGASFGRAWRFTPYAGMLASHLRLDDFAETRSSGQPATELAFRNWSVGSLRTRVGFDLARPFANNRITPQFFVVWLHELEKDRTLSAGLVAANGASYLAPGRPAETDLVQAGFGLDWRITRRLGFSANAGLARGRNTDSVSDFTAGLRWEF